jgi:CSLREA domain-containing protein
MRTIPLLILGSLLLLRPAAAATVVVTSLGDAAGTCPDASNCTLRAAITAANANDRIEFSPGLAFPAVLTLASDELGVNKSLTVAGPGADRLTVRAASANRVINLTAGTLVIEDLTLDRGRALGVNGTNSTNGAAGQQGASAEGGCIITANATSLVLQRVALRDCRAVAGSGGDGGNGANAFMATDGGFGGSGALARGGAIFARGQVTLMESSISESAAFGGNGGDGGTGGAGTSIEGDGGNGAAGGGARGGAIALSGAGAALLVRNSSLISNVAEGGDGGAGGDGGNGGAAGQGDGGNGGSGGLANGGQVHLDTGVGVVDFEFASLGPSASTGGLGGLRGQGDVDGTNGLVGATNGELLFSNKSPLIRSSVFAGENNAGDCAGPATITASGTNLDSDDTCNGFGGTVNFAANFVGPALVLDRGLAVLQPRSGAPVIDAADNCLDLDGIAVTIDQSGRARPLDGNGDTTAVCDVGAIEFTFEIFRNGFESTL